MRRILTVLLSALALTATTATLAEAAPKPEITADSCAAAAGDYAGGNGTAVYSEDGKSRTCTITVQSQLLGSTGYVGSRDQYAAYQTISFYYVGVRTLTQAKKNAPITQTETNIRVVNSDDRKCIDTSYYFGHGIENTVDTSFCDGLYL